MALVDTDAPPIAIAQDTPRKVDSVPITKEPTPKLLVINPCRPMTLPRIASGAIVWANVLEMVLTVVPNAPTIIINAKDIIRLFEKAKNIKNTPKIISAPMSTHPFDLMSPAADTVIAPIIPPRLRKVERNPRTTGPAPKTSLATIGNIDQQANPKLSVNNKTSITVLMGLSFRTKSRPALKLRQIEPVGVDLVFKFGIGKTHMALMNKDRLITNKR